MKIDSQDGIIIWTTKRHEFISQFFFHKLPAAFSDVVCVNGNVDNVTVMSWQRYSPEDVVPLSEDVLRKMNETENLPYYVVGDKFAFHDSKIAVSDREIQFWEKLDDMRRDAYSPILEGNNLKCTRKVFSRDRICI